MERPKPTFGFGGNRPTPPAPGLGVPPAPGWEWYVIQMLDYIADLLENIKVCLENTRK